MVTVTEPDVAPVSLDPSFSATVAELVAPASIAPVRVLLLTVISACPPLEPEVPQRSSASESS